MKRNVTFLALCVSALSVVIVLGQVRRATQRAAPKLSPQVGSMTQIMKIEDLPDDIREMTESETHPRQSRVEVTFYDLNHDGQDEWIVSEIDEYSHGGLDSVYQKGNRPTAIYIRDGQRWHVILYNINDIVKFIPTGKDGEYDAIEYTSNYYTVGKGYADVVLTFRWIDGKYQICQARDVQSSQVVPARSLKAQGANRTLVEEGFIINESCP